MAKSSRQDPDMRVAEYVLGTLAANERAGVERELEGNRALQDEVAFWEEQLGQLALALTPVDPPAATWEAIRMRLHDPRPERPQQADDAPAAAPRRPSRLWRGWAIAASVIALVLAGLLYVVTNRPVPAPTPTYASIFYDQPSSTGWLLTASTSTGQMSVTAVGDYPLAPDKELRLWIIPPEGKPIASGIVPAEGANSWRMSARVSQLLREPATAIAVSLEAAGEPVSDGPQGPILWKAQVRQRG